MSEVAIQSEVVTGGVTAPGFKTIVTDGDRPLTLDDLPQRLLEEPEVATLTPQQKFDALPDKTKAEIMAGRQIAIEAGYTPKSLDEFHAGNAPTPVVPAAPELVNRPLNFGGSIPDSTRLEQEAGRARLKQRAVDYKAALAANAAGAAERLKTGTVGPDDLDYPTR